MKKYLYLFFILGFTIVAIAGFTVMHSHQECPFLGSCGADSFAMMSAHFNALNSFSAAYFYFPLAIALIGIALISVSGVSDYQKLSFLRVRDKFDLPISFFNREFFRWLELHNNRDSFASF